MADENVNGGGATGPAGSATPGQDPAQAAVPPEQDAVDLDSVEDDRLVRINAKDLRNLKQTVRAFKDAGIDPTLAPQVVQAALAYSQAMQAQSQGKPAETPADDDRSKARKALAELAPEIPEAVKVTRQLIEHNVEHAKAVAVDAREVLQDELASRHLPIDDDALNHMEELLTVSIQQSETDWARFMRGVGHDRILKKHLDKVLKTVTKLSGGHARSTAAAVEAVKRSTATLPPRLPGGSGVTAPAGTTQGPPKSLKEAEARARARFAAAS